MKDAISGQKAASTRFLAIALEANFVADDAHVDHSLKIFRQDSTLRDFLSSGPCAAAYLRKFFFPFLARYSEADCYQMIENPPASIVSSTSDLMARLAGGTTNGRADGRADDDVIPLALRVHQRMSKLKHIKKYAISRCSLISGTWSEDSSRKGADVEGSRVSNFTSAIGSWPFLWGNYNEGGFRRLFCDYFRFAEIYMRLGGDSVFGGYTTWSVNELPACRKSFEDEHVRQLTSDAIYPYAIADALIELVDLPALESYAQTASDRRQKTLGKYICRVKRQGLPADSGHMSLAVSYYRPHGLGGRKYGVGVCLQKLTREARAVAVGPEAIDIDIANAHPTLMDLELKRICAEGSHFSSISHYASNPAGWRSLVGEYFGVCPKEAKLTLCKIFYGGSPFPPGQSAEIPILCKLASEVGRSADVILADEAHSELRNMFNDRRNPVFSRLSYALGKLEDVALEHVKEVLVSNGYNVSCNLFDGCIVQSKYSLRDSASAEIVEIEQMLTDAATLKCKATHLSRPANNCGNPPKPTQAGGYSTCDFWKNMRLSCEHTTYELVRKVAGKDNCLPTSLINIMGAAATTEAECMFRGHNGPYPVESALRSLNCLKSARAHTSAVRDFIEGAANFGSAGSRSRDVMRLLLVCEQHAVGLIVGSNGQTLVYDSREVFAGQISNWQLVKIIEAESSGILLFAVEDVSGNDEHQAQGRVGNYYSFVVVGCDAVSINFSDAGATADGRLVNRIRSEYDAASRDAQKCKRRADSSDAICPLCPFRSFGPSRYGRVTDHLATYHLPSGNFACPKAQERVARCLHEDDMYRCALQSLDLDCDLLLRAAELLRTWCCDVTEETAKLLRNSTQVDPFVVLLISMRSGCKYVTKEQTAHHLRVNQQLYIDREFADFLVAKACLSNCSVHKVQNEVRFHMRLMGFPCSALLPTRSDCWQDLIRFAFESPGVQNWRERAISELTKAQEWAILSHDGTYKVACSLIGQPKHGTGKVLPGEHHVVHTVRGRTGAVPSICPYESESAMSSIGAITKSLPRYARETCLFLFSDSPQGFARMSNTGEAVIKAALPNLRGIGEDPLHLVFRLMDCSGQSRNPLSSAVLRAQLKFSPKFPLRHDTYWGLDPINGKTNWGAVDLTAAETNRIMAKLDTAAYVEKPYSSHEEYVRVLNAIALSFPSEVNRRNSKKRTALMILKSGSEYSHFGYLQNGAAHLGSIPHDWRALLATGTTGNEALHREINSWAVRITGQHIGRLKLACEVFSFAKLCSHFSAYMFPAPRQVGQSEVLHSLCGFIARGFVDIPMCEVAECVVVSRPDLRKPPIKLDATNLDRRRADRERRKHSSQKEKNLAKKKNPKGRPTGALKRTVFTTKRK